MNAKVSRMLRHIAKAESKSKKEYYRAWKDANWIARSYFRLKWKEFKNKIVT